jgi:hypothetical protein
MTGQPTFRLVAFSSGRAIGSLAYQGGLYEIDVSDAVLATGGALASGKGGIADQLLEAGTPTSRFFDDVVVSTPPTEPIVLYSGRKLEVRHDDTLREATGGGTYGQPASYRGSRFKVQPAGAENRTTRVVAKASRNDLSSAEDANLTDQILLEATITPRCSVVPRS